MTCDTSDRPGHAGAERESPQAVPNGHDSTSPRGDDDDPICVTGIACRLPGDVRTPSQMWDFMMQSKSAQGPVPTDRFNMKGYHHPDGNRAGVMAADGGYFLQHDVRQFENTFFGLNNLETMYMDPKQRQLLEVTFECLEDAGMPLEKISGTNTGVFVGNFTMDYQTMQTRDPDYGSRYTATGIGTAIMANRISHIFNLHGPSFTIDTACSSAIYCLHNAVRSIKSNDCDSAIVAAANLITSPEQHLGTMKGGVLSPTSTCHTFDVSADGYGRAEAVSAVYLKRLSKALEDGDHIWAVIRGSAINANGKTNGIAQPSAALQEVVIRKAYADAGLAFDGTDYVECHGTGTAVGDPIEVDAVASCFLPRKSIPLRIGSVKTNFGHSEAASGLTSLIKVALSFENGFIPPTCGIKTPNPKLKLDSRPIQVVTTADSWPRELRRASINSFGYGGANAHVIVESLSSFLNGKPHHGQFVSSSLPGRTLVLPLSASTETSLNARVEDLVRYVEQTNHETLDRLAFTLAERRSHLGSRSYLLAEGSSKDSLHKNRAERVENNKPSSASPLPFAFAFTGQGAQYAGMAKELLETENTFANTISALDAVLSKLPMPYGPSWTLRQTLEDPAETSQINDVSRSQPICTAVQIGLVNVLRNWSVNPSAVVGHSSGEIAAAYACGIITSTQAILIAYLRGYAVSQLNTSGAMMAVGISSDEAEKLIEDSGLRGQVCVSCVNSPESVTISGSIDGIETFGTETSTQHRGKLARKLETGGRAYHSHLMTEIGPLYEQLLAGFVSRGYPRTVSNIRMYSSVGYLGDELSVFDGRSKLLPQYWRENLEKPVQFSSALSSLVGSGEFHLIEIGPHSALRGYIQQIRTCLGIDQPHLPYSPTLVRKKDSGRRLKELAGELYVHGHQLNWLKVNNLSEMGLRPLHDLPNYPWDYSAGILWSEPRASVELRNRQYIRHELLGSKQLAGDGTNWSWRNILHLDEMPWIRGHKVDNQVVFPATGYLAVAMEALSQILNLRDQVESYTFDFENVNIKAALVLSEVDKSGSGKELHTAMSPRKLSAATTSSHWHDFSIYSWADGLSTLHCAGGIRIDHTKTITGSVEVQGMVVEKWPPEPWYEKGKQHSLYFEGDFISLTSLHTDANRSVPESVCTTRTAPLSARHPYATQYPIHPVTIDACLQAAIMGSTAGKLDTLRAYLPVFISKARIRPLGDVEAGGEATIQTRARKTGFATMEVESTLRNENQEVLVDLVGVRMSKYTAKQHDGKPKVPQAQRNPCLRATWKPDIQRLHAGAQDDLRRYVNKALKQRRFESLPKDKWGIVGVLLDLAGHKNPSMRILSMMDMPADFSLDFLDRTSSFRRYGEYGYAELDQDGNVLIDGLMKPPFDIALIPNDAMSQLHRQEKSDQLDSLLTEHGIVIADASPDAIRVLSAKNFHLVEVDEIILARKGPYSSLVRDRDVLIVYNEPSSAVLQFGRELIDCIKVNSGMNEIHTVSFSELDQIQISENTVCISMIEIEHVILALMGEKEMNLLRILTNSVKDLVWVTGAGMLNGIDPNLCLSHGLSRALMLEQPALRWSIVDVGHVDDEEPRLLLENVMNLVCSSFRGDDKEFIINHGLTYINRFYADEELNMLFERRLTSPWFRFEQHELGTVSPVKLAIEEIGQLDSIYFQQLDEPPTPPPAGFIDVSVQAVSLNAKDVYALSGRVETKDGTISNEFTGIVTAVGADIGQFKIGDRVVVMAPNHFKTVERVPVWAAQKLLPGESFVDLAGLPIVYATALYALYDRAYLRRGESILIHSGSGALGVALINIARHVGAVIYATAGSDAKRKYLVDELGIPDSNVFSSRDLSFAEGIKRCTGGRGVDVVVSSLVGDLMHASWECIGQFGRFVEVGKRELLDAGRLGMEVFLRNATFTAFDLSEIFYQNDQLYRDLWSRLMSDVLGYYRAGKLTPAPNTVFDIAETGQAYRYFSNRDRIGKIIVSMEDPTSIITVAPASYSTSFSPEKIYLLVGCLGGLGRSLSLWMFARGARHFCFLGRSGLQKPAAKGLVDRLLASGATVQVVEGDVSRDDDVWAAVEACNQTGRCIGGVVQAAMGLNESLFSVMNNEAWHKAIQPKWLGTWNLHEALEGNDQALDFFLLMSSMSGSVGTATESNYCAANSFLDAFANFRRGLGKPAISVGLGMISEVGYLHENPQVEELLLRRGIQPLTEVEFLQIIDLSLSGAGNASSHQQNYVSESMILTGLEPFGFLKLMDRGYDVQLEVAQDPRLTLLSTATAAEKAKLSLRLNGVRDKKPELSQQIANTPWLKPLPAHIAEALARDVEASSLRAAVLQFTKKRFSNLILVPADTLDEAKPFSRFGVDSMIASEFRTWLWNTFEVDVHFLDLLGPQMSIATIADIVVSKLGVYSASQSNRS